MKRFLIVALAATALSSPAFAADDSVGVQSQTGAGVSVGGVNARVGADTGVGATTNTAPTAPSSAQSDMQNNSASSSSAPAPSSSSSSATSSTTTASSSAIPPENLTRNDVILIQQSLRQEGIYNGTADGVWGPRTANALMQFQEQNKLSSTSGLNSDTLNELGVKLNGSAAASSKNDWSIQEQPGPGSNSSTSGSAGRN